MSESNSGYLTPDDITGASFETKRRGGFDPDAVKRHLASVAASVQELRAERDALAEQVSSLKADLETAMASPAAPETLDEAGLTERLGQDAARVLAEARSAAADRISEAEAEADDIRAAAEEIHAARSAAADEEAQRIRAAAELVMEERKTEAERAAAAIVSEAEAGADQVRTAGSSDRESADADASRIVREAELTRRQILEDLARRRSAARRQIEQLRAGRERLLASHETVRRALDEISEELTISMSEARAAAETAGHSVSDTTIEELEAEIETARLTGLLDTGPVPVVRRSSENSNPADTAVDPKPDEPEAKSVASVPTPKIVEADKPEGATKVESDGSEASDGDDVAEGAAPLASVVQLDRARNDVDTATHPAKGREAGNGRPAETSPAPSTGKSSKSAAPKVTKLESVKTAPEEPANIAPIVAASDDVSDDEDGGSVDDLFASLRSDPPAKPAKKKAAPKKSAAKATAKKKKAKPAPEKQVEVDSSEMARRLKRVLADEQSKAMSKVKSAEELPSVEDLFGSTDAHVETYWAEVLGQLDNPLDASDAVRSPISGLVELIRRRVGDALEGADNDQDSAIAALRSVYRGVKTQQIGDTADVVCRAAGVGVGG